MIKYLCRKNPLPYIVSVNTGHGDSAVPMPFAFLRHGREGQQNRPLVSKTQNRPPSFGISNGGKNKDDFSGWSYNIGGSIIYGFDFSGVPKGPSVYSFVISNSYGIYVGRDYYWCID